MARHGGLKRRSALPVADSGLTKVQSSVHEEGTRQVQRIASYPRVTVSADGRGVCSHVGSRLLADVAAAAGVGGGVRRRGRRRSSAAVGACSGSGVGRSGGDAGRRRGDDQRSGGAAGSARPVRAGGLDRDGVAGARLGRRTAARSAEAGSGGGAGTGLDAARRGRPAGPDGAVRRARGARFGDRLRRHAW